MEFGALGFLQFSYSRILVKSHQGSCEYAVFDMSKINE